MSYRDLRAVQSEHQLQVNALPTIALLPSPVFSELQIGHISDSHSATGDLHKERPPQVEHAERDSPYEAHNIISAYCDESQMKCPERSLEHAGESPSDRILPAIIGRPERRRDVGIVCAPLYFPQHLQHSQHERPKTCSSEADWLAGNMSVWLEGLPGPQIRDLHQLASIVVRQDEIDEHQIVSC